MTTDYDPTATTLAVYRRTWERAEQDRLREAAALRVAYGQLSWRERLVTPPPPGWQGAWMAWLVSRCVRRANISIWFAHLADLIHKYGIMDVFRRYTRSIRLGPGR